MVCFWPDGTGSTSGRYIPSPRLCAIYPLPKGIRRYKNLELKDAPFGAKVTVNLAATPRNLPSKNSTEATEICAPDQPLPLIREAVTFPAMSTSVPSLIRQAVTFPAISTSTTPFHSRLFSHSIPCNIISDKIPPLWSCGQGSILGTTRFSEK
jgi:hypothetical protein